MIIHVVQQGDTLASIANTYGVTTIQLIDQNEIPNPDNLLIGQDIVIQVPTLTHTVISGDTLSSIASQYGISVWQLLQNNPKITLDTILTPGETLNITYDNQKLGDISVNGYVYPYVNTDVLRQTLPYLTSITIFTYGFTPEGALLPIDDDAVIALAKEYEVAPIMLLSTLSETGTFSNALANTLLINEELQDTLIDNILDVMGTKGYEGLDVDFEFIYPEDADAYVAFINKLRNRLNDEDYEVMVALAPKIAVDQPGTLYEGHKYRELGAAANTVLLMTYEWGYTYGPPMAVSPLDKVREVLDFGVSQILPQKIYMGVPNYGYDWKLPFVRGESQARSLSNVGALELAIQQGVEIQYDETSQAPFFNYESEDGSYHEVWFENARSIDAKVRLVPEYGFRGIAFWNLMKFFPQSWLVINGLFNIRKGL